MFANLTFSLRSEGSTFTGGNSTFTGSNSTVTGTAFGPQAVVQVRWGWLAFVGSQVFLATIILGYIVFVTHSSKMQVFKGSSLPTMCALDASTRRHLGTMDDFEALRERAERVTVRFDRGVLRRLDQG